MQIYVTSDAFSVKMHVVALHKMNLENTTLIRRNQIFKSDVHRRSRYVDPHNALLPLLCV